MCSCKKGWWCVWCWTHSCVALQGALKPFKEVIDVSAGDPHRAGFKPVTFVRQVSFRSFKKKMTGDLCLDCMYPFSINKLTWFMYICCIHCDGILTQFFWSSISFFIICVLFPQTSLCFSILDFNTSSSAHTRWSTFHTFSPVALNPAHFLRFWPCVSSLGCWKKKVFLWTSGGGLRDSWRPAREEVWVRTRHNALLFKKKLELPAVDEYGGSSSDRPTHRLLHGLLRPASRPAKRRPVRHATRRWSAGTRQRHLHFCRLGESPDGYLFLFY